MVPILDVAPGVEQCRVQAVRVFAGGSHCLHVAHLYREPAWGQAARLRTNEILTAVLSSFESFGQVPAVIAGDFNQVLSDLPAVFLLRAAGWVNLAEISGISAPTLPARDRGRVIDHVWVNRAAFGQISGFRVGREAGVPVRPVLRFQWSPGPGELYWAR